MRVCKEVEVGRLYLCVDVLFDEGCKLLCQLSARARESLPEKKKDE